jgi:hypothetical protein
VDQKAPLPIFSYRHLGEEEGLGHKIIADHVHFVVEHLNPDKIFNAFKNAANLILLAKSAR